ncbi:hypothetical protein B0T17DRAFT_651542 [Bombardia bombarda]|uniref:BRCT domain-containing protein n=1 Tax=Bombardia bombarda TaxID=252184 RepID=A0AA39XMN3_9PEZI|nr:hypothetical protein B0T17DRAFT_651542 [Bombardia bombarda]
MRGRRTEKPSLNGLTISVAGELGDQWTETNIARWVELREGSFSQQMDESVTHLICSPAEFEKRGPKVKTALKHKRGSKACHIVTKDWLEDSINLKRRLPEYGFSLVKSLKKKREKERIAEKVTKGFEQAEKSVNPNFYHLYRDSTFFHYEVTINRDDEEHGIYGQRYVLSLYESHAKPHLYWFVAKFYKKKHVSLPNFHRPSETPGSFNREFTEFSRFFHKKTGIPWVHRLVRAGTMDKTFFQYTPPVRGKPVGWISLEDMPIMKDKIDPPDAEKKEDEHEQQPPPEQAQLELPQSSPEDLHPEQPSTPVASATVAAIPTIENVIVIDISSDEDEADENDEDDDMIMIEALDDTAVPVVADGDDDCQPISTVQYV